MSSTLAICLVVLGFVVLVFYLAKLVVLQLEQRADEDVMRAKKVYQDIIDQKERAIQEKKKLEQEAVQIFTLYDMTKEIVKNFNELEAFEIFKKKLDENITIEDCQLLDVSTEKVKEARSLKEQEIFPLKSKDVRLGYLMYRGVSAQDKEKFFILAHQFALALRRIKLYKDIERMAITDSLTEVHTRRYYLERLEEELGRSKNRNTQLSFVMIDVDHFKALNDRYGHLTGDRVLQKIGKIIRENIREIDIAGRFGGEEFSIVLPETDLPGAMQVAERIRKAVETAVIQAYDQTVQTTISIGIATYPQDGDLQDAIIDKADWALYRAKSQGRNCVCAFGMYNK